MHESSVAATIWGQICAVEKSNPGYRAIRVEIDVGAYSGVEQKLLADALVLLAQDQQRQEFDLIIKRVPLVARCEDCLIDFPITNYLFNCDNCGGKWLRMIDGDSIRLMHLDLQLVTSRMQLT